MTVLMVGALVAVAAWFVGGRSGGESNARADGDSVIEEFDVEDRRQSESFEARMLSGDRLATSSLRGQVVVFNVWGSWCVPCVKEAPALVEVANEFDGQVLFVGINIRDNEAAARAFERKYNVPYDSVVAQDSPRAMLSFDGALAAAAVPTTLVIDRQGRVAARAIGPVSATTLRSLIQPVLAESDDSEE
ncbi:hypothetical protein ASG90_17155 [Nocardioides sp. Soil797]|nr:hypothetical protein ASG90_17155 [Nocardioides sp. Soil797]